MHQGTERPREGCNLHGALQTLSCIRNVVPVIHSNSGCGIQNFLARKAGSGLGYINGYSVPSSNVYEKQIIFGGASRLREQIKNTVKVVKGNLYAIISGCESEMVGDDVFAMTQEITEQGESVICCKAPGFRGNQYAGYENAVDAIISQLPEIVNYSAGTTKGLVNIWGVLPGQDICWQGNLNEIKRILGNAGIKANVLFGYGQGIEHWKNIRSAELNVVVSKWGIKAAESLKWKYGMPYILFDDVGMGEKETGNFVRRISESLAVNMDEVEAYLKKEKDKFTHNLEKIAEYYFDFDFQKSVAVVGDESTVIRYSGFLSNYVGMEVEAAIITDFTGETDEQNTPDKLKPLANEIYFSKDSGEIDEILANSNIDLILGSGLENPAAKKLNIPNCIISYPAYGKIVIDKSNVGYAGAVSLLEDLGSLIINGQ